MRPVLLGNIKGLQDPYRNPTTQKGFAERGARSPTMVTSFADGTKVSFEQTVVANATGMTVAKRGMHGYTFDAGTPIMEAAKLYDADEILAGPGIVDYVVGCEPGPGRLRRSAPSSTRASGTTSTSTSSARGRSTASTPPTTSATSRCRRRSPAPRCCGDAAITPIGAPLRRGGGDGQARPQGRRGDRRARRLHRLRRGRDRGGHRPRRPAADRRRRRLQAEARRPQGRGADLRRRRAPRRPAGRQAPRRAGRPSSASSARPRRWPDKHTDGPVG